MKVYREIQCKSEEEAIGKVYATPLNELFPDVPPFTYVYVDSDAKIVAAGVPSDATPNDEVFCAGRTSP